MFRRKKPAQPLPIDLQKIVISYYDPTDGSEGNEGNDPSKYFSPRSSTSRLLSVIHSSVGMDSRTTDTLRKIAGAEQVVLEEKRRSHQPIRNFVGVVLFTSAAPVALVDFGKNRYQKYASTKNAKTDKENIQDFGLFVDLSLLLQEKSGKALPLPRRLP